MNLEPIPIASTADRRIRAVLHAEARRMRIAMAEAAVHTTFALGAVVWALAAVTG